MESIVDVLKKRTSFSFEVFPPKEDKPMEPLLECLDELYKYQPDFISCTYGAGGTNAGKNTEICRRIVADGHRAVTHFTCVGNSREYIKDAARNYLDHGVNHILALRGDLPKGWDSTRGAFNYANEMISYLRKEFGDQFTIGMAGDPEKHIQCPSLKEDIAHLKIKQDAGADYLITQLCFDMDHFKSWFEKIRRAGITVPVIVGVMPVVSIQATLRMALSVNGCSIPRELAEIISRYYEDKEGFKKAGIEFTVNQIYDYMAEGINGIHLYTLNKSPDIVKIMDMAGLRGKAEE